MNLTFEKEEDKSLLQQYRENNQFCLVNTLLQNGIDSVNGLNWTIARLSMVMTRRPLYYLFNLVFSCALISLITCLMSLGPPESIDKVPVHGVRWTLKSGGAESKKSQIHNY